MTKTLKRWRRAAADWLRSLAGRVDPGWALPAQYTGGHILRYHELMIDVGLADAYDQIGGDGAPSGPAGAHSGAAPPSDVRHDPANKNATQSQAAAAMHGAEDGITVEQAQRIRRAFAGEIERLNLIVLDIPDRQASEVPVDVTIQALQHFVPVYAAATTALIGTPSATMQA